MHEHPYVVFIHRMTWQLIVGCMLSSVAFAGDQPEFAMVPGMKIEANSPSGMLVIEAIDKVTRRYSWGSSSKAFTLLPRPKRWMGSKGVSKGVGDTDTHVVLEEGQQHFYSESEALTWIRQRDVRMHSAYTQNGLVVGWYETKAPPPQRVALIAEVWQIYIHGRKPNRLPGASDQRVRVSRPTSLEPEIGMQIPSPPMSIGGREYSGKAIDFMKEGNHSAVEVEEVIKQAKQVVLGNKYCYWGWNANPSISLSACTDSSGKVWWVSP
jgi:hypothetical protein